MRRVDGGREDGSTRAVDGRMEPVMACVDAADAQVARWSTNRVAIVRSCIVVAVVVVVVVVAVVVVIVASYIINRLLLQPTSMHAPTLESVAFARLSLVFPLRVLALLTSRMFVGVCKCWSHCLHSSQKKSAKKEQVAMTHGNAGQQQQPQQQSATHLHHHISPHLPTHTV